MLDESGEGGLFQAMKHLSLLLLNFAPFPDFANESCPDLWWGRNHFFDQAGYYFSSPLG